MKKMKMGMFVSAALISLVAAVGCNKPPEPVAPAAAPAKLSVSDAWVLEPLKTKTLTAAYMKISNPGTAEDALVSASTNVDTNTELHEMAMQGEKMTMRPVKKIAVGAGQTVELKSGGLHVMLIGLKKQLKEGDTVHLKLHFENAGDMEMDLPVKKAPTTDKK